MEISKLLLLMIEFISQYKLYQDTKSDANGIMTNQNTQTSMTIYENHTDKRLEKVTVGKLDCPPTIISTLCNSDILWMCAKFEEL